MKKIICLDKKDIVCGIRGYNFHIFIDEVNSISLTKEACEELVNDIKEYLSNPIFNKKTSEPIAEKEKERFEWIGEASNKTSKTFGYKKKHTCGLDGDPGAVAPLDGRCWQCEHANENPHCCKCPSDCYCRSNTCRSTDRDNGPLEFGGQRFPS